LRGWVERVLQQVLQTGRFELHPRDEKALLVEVLRSRIDAHGTRDYPRTCGPNVSRSQVQAMDEPEKLAYAGAMAAGTRRGDSAPLPSARNTSQTDRDGRHAGAAESGTEAPGKGGTGVPARGCRRQPSRPQSARIEKRFQRETFFAGAGLTNHRASRSGT